MGSGQRGADLPNEGGGLGGCQRAGLAQPLVLLVISACVGGLMMFMYSLLLIRLNRRVLTPEIRPGAGRVAALVWAFVLFGVLSALTLVQQVPKLWGAG